MDIEVELVSSNFSVDVELHTNLETEVLLNVANKLSDLIDIDSTNVHDQYVLMYNETTQKYEFVNPDKVLSSASSTETIQPGLPADFENVLDVDLDNRIDLDAGSF
jgi:hypothetical protein